MPLQDKVDLACDNFSSAAAILQALGNPPANRPVLLSLAPDASIESRQAVIDAINSLPTMAKRARVLINLPESFDGTEPFRCESSRAHNVLRLTEFLRPAAEPIWVVTLSNASVWHLDSIYSLARDQDISVFIVRGSNAMSEDAQLFAWDFITYFLLQESKSNYSSDAINYFKALQDELFHNKHGEKNAGELNFQSDELLTDALDQLTATQAAEPGYAVSVTEVLELAGQMLRAQINVLRSWPRKKNSPEKFHSAVLVGAYGGEHIGDIAILGGVLLRMHREFGLSTAVLMTQRPNHTQHLVKHLNTPVTLTVAEYTIAEIDKHLPSAQALIHAGGPLTDIPKQLTRHLYAAGKAKLLGKVYLMEGIGPTTFKRTTSRITARQLVTLADRIVVRTQQDATSQIIQGCDIQVSRDPAFDFLQTLGPELQLQAGESDEIESLLASTEGRPVIGINIRPINDLFTPSVDGQDRTSRTRAIENRMEENLAAGITQFSNQCDVQPVFVFFPMNAIQFGKSDNRSAYQIIRHLAPNIDVRVWHSDASLAAVISLIRKLDTVIAMRFHAAIFSLSQNCMPVGIDYRIGMKYKVSAVMEDAGQAEFCCRIDEVESDWISRKLHERLNTSKERIA